MTRRLLFYSVLLAFVVTVVVATGASVVTDGDDERDELTDHVVAYPHPGDNGAYTYLDDDGEIVLDVTASNDHIEADGVPSGTVTKLDDVFVLENTGEEFATVWIGHDAEDVKFHVDGASIEHEADGVVLKPNGTVDVGIIVDARDYEKGDRLIDGINIHITHANVDEPDPVHDRPVGASGASSSGCSPAQVRTAAPTEETRTVSVTNVQTCNPEWIDLLSLGVGEYAKIEGMSVLFAETDEAKFTLNATGALPTQLDGESLPEHVDPVDQFRAETSVAPIGSVMIEDAPAPKTFESMNLHLTLDRAWLEGAGIAPDEVSLYRHNGTTWVPEDLEPLDNKDKDTNRDDGPSVTETHGIGADMDDVVAYDANLYSTGTYTLGVEAPILTVDGLAVEPDVVSPDETATATLTVTNHGDADASFIGNPKLVDDDSESTATNLEEMAGTVTAGESADFTVEVATNESGKYALEVSYEYTRSDDNVIIGDGIVDKPVSVNDETPSLSGFWVLLFVGPALVVGAGFVGARLFRSEH